MDKNKVLKSTGFENELPKYDLLNLIENYGWLKNMLKDNGEVLYLSCEIMKSNRFGRKAPRIIFLTDKAIYNYHMTKQDGSKKILLDRVDALTIS